MSNVSPYSRLEARAPTGLRSTSFEIIAASCGRDVRANVPPFRSCRGSTAPGGSFAAGAKELVVDLLISVDICEALTVLLAVVMWRPCSGGKEGSALPAVDIVSGMGMPTAAGCGPC